MIYFRIREWRVVENSAIPRPKCLLQLQHVGHTQGSLQRAGNARDRSLEGHVLTNSDRRKSEILNLILHYENFVTTINDHFINECKMNYLN